MPNERLPKLGDTFRRYVENTRRARLASRGIERYEVVRGRGARAAGIALAIVAALAVAAWLALAAG